MADQYSITLLLKVKCASQDAAETRAMRLADHIQSAHGDVIVAAVESVEPRDYLGTAALMGRYGM